MPKVQRFDFVVRGTPDEVAARLRAVTRNRILPYRTSFFGKGALGGRVSRDEFRVAIDDWGFLSESQAVAVGKLTAEGPGRTRVRGEAGLPVWVTWMFRILFLVVAVVMAKAGVDLFPRVADSPAFVVGLVAYAAFAVILGGYAVGKQVARANAQVGRLIERLEATAGASAPSAAEDAGEERRVALDRACHHARVGVDGH